MASNDDAPLEEYDSVKALYDAITAEMPDAIDYEHFRRKIRRIEDGNPATIKRLLRALKIEKPAPKGGGRQGYPVSPFLAYDGEGFDDRYTLLANSLGDSISNPEGLSSLDCLEFLTLKYDTPVKRVFYSFGYDINHIIRDMPDRLIVALHDSRVVKWENYTMQYIPGKIFRVNNFAYHDVFSFFSRSFVKTVELMLGKDAVPPRLLEGKAARGSFETWDEEKVKAYNAIELDLLVQIMDKLREALEGIDVHLTSWYGPGTIAAYWLKEHGIVPDEYPEDIEKALGRAYYGGRFEQISLGKIKPVYEYDIRSAYPSVMADMPYFKSWSKRKKYEPNPYSIWNVSFDLRDWYANFPVTANSPYQRDIFLPLPMRRKDQHICYPLVGQGWYWQSEIQLVLDFFPGAKLTINKGYVASTEGKPFGWVRDLYDYRRQLKQSGNLSQYALKVGLNSLYGKTAQRVGKRKYHSLAWAGYITSTTRAKIARAGYEGAYKNPATNASKIIGFATDALFSTEPLKHLSLTEELGGWEESRFTTGYFFQSGVYRLEDSDGTITDRYRGSPLRTGIDDIIAQIKKNPKEDPVVNIGRFISNLLAIRSKKTFGPLRLQFVKVVHHLSLKASFKRHYAFPGEWVDIGKPIRDFHPNYASLLTDRVLSRPKVWMNEPAKYIPPMYDMFLNADELWDNTESEPSQVLRDQAIMQISEEESLAASAEFAEANNIELLDDLVVVVGDVPIRK